MYRVAAIALGLISSAAGAAPVYLKCQLDYDSSSNKSQTHELDLTLNEDTGTVTISFVGTSLADTVRGAFNADKVTFKHDN
ncbi:MAG TPA: hypothetical protein VNS11_09490, partial [Sphingomicrobium sp.]|nr:hypothetical protein [Sphingomicrobium sp.]